MNVTRENTAPQMATLRIEITPEDYSGNVQKILKDYQKKASIPGFRPGHVPAGLVKKMYGKVVMAEEINKLLTDTLTNYIRDEKIDILGNPIPNKEKTKDSDFEDGETMEFYFDLGIAPEFEVKLDESLEVENHNIIVDEEMVDKYIADTQNRFGEYTHPDEAGEKDVVSGDLDEVNADGTPVEGGLHKNAFIYLDKVNETTAKTKLESLKRNEKVVFDPIAFFGTADEAKNVLMLTAAELEKPGLMLAFTLKDIVHLVPSELNAEFFEKVYPGMNLETIEEFKAQVRKDASASFTGETDKLLFNAISEALVKNTEITLPDEFMKRWLLDHEENKLTVEQIELEYPAFAESMKWQLIENRILRDNSISVSDEDIRNYVRTQLLRQMNSVSDDPEIQKRYDSIVDAFMQNKEQIQRINDQLYTAKLLDLFKSKLTLVTKEVSYDEFVNLVNEKHAHEHHHDHDHDHDHDHHHDHDHDHEGHGHSH